MPFMKLPWPLDPPTQCHVTSNMGAIQFPTRVCPVRVAGGGGGGAVVKSAW